MRLNREPHKTFENILTTVKKMRTAFYGHLRRTRPERPYLLLVRKKKDKNTIAEEVPSGSEKNVESGKKRLETDQCSEKNAVVTDLRREDSLRREESLRRE